MKIEFLLLPLRIWRAEGAKKLTNPLVLPAAGLAAFFSSRTRRVRPRGHTTQRALGTWGDIQAVTVTRFQEQLDNYGCQLLFGGEASAELAFEILIGHLR